MFCDTNEALTGTHKLLASPKRGLAVSDSSSADTNAVRAPIGRSPADSVSPQIHAFQIAGCGVTGACRWLVALVLLLSFAPGAKGQCEPGWLPGDGVPGVDSYVNALAVLPGGDVIAGGSFTAAGGVAASRIARYTPSTNAWSALGTGTSGSVYALAVLPGGDVIVGGSNALT